MDLPSFDTLAALFERDPDAFDRLRKDLLEDEIRSAHPENRRRLRGLQFQIEGIRRTSKNPLDCCVRIQRLLDKQLEKLSSVVNGHPRPVLRSPSQDNIIPWPGKDKMQ